VRSSTKRERSASTTCAVCGASVQGTQGIRHLRLHVLCMHLLLHLRLHGGQSLMHGESHGWPATSTDGDQITSPPTGGCFVILPHTRVRSHFLVHAT
jgi:hypothetical protein